MKPTGHDALLLALCLQGNAVPEWVPIVPAPDAEGWVRGRDGRKWRLSRPAELVERLNRAARTRELVFDYEHASELRAPKGEEAPAAAWGREFRVGEGGAIESRAEWTPRAGAAVANREYRYLSPAILFDKQSLEIVDISSVGLTNRHNLFLPSLNREDADPSTHQDMNPEQIKALCQELGIAADSDADAILAAVRKQKTDLASALNREGMPSLEKYVPRADYDAAVSRATNAEQALKADQDKARNAAIESEVEAAVKAGKITPATKDFYLATCRQEGGLEQFRKFVKDAPVIADPSKIPAKAPEESAATALNAEEKAICAQMGISEEDYLKTKKAEFAFA